MARVPEALTMQLDTPVATAQPIGGGSINEAARLTLEDGRTLFLKTHPSPPAGFFEAEAAGLRALAAGNAVRIPAVIAVAEEGLILEWLDGRPGGDFARQLGEQLAKLHSTTANEFGFERDNFCGLTPQPNPRMRDGFRFFAEARLLHQGRMARDSGRLGHGDIQQLEWLAGRLDRWIPEQPASLIHGDLWSGNIHCGPAGEPVLIDPATHYGWAEADLAMTTMFGSQPRAFYEAYLANSAVERDWEDRAPLYNLYHELNHLNLFGGPWAGGVRQTLKRFT
ncbi:fructosamine kinase family protein [Halospina sp. K52047b]|uniref:fructosamine kinase family protein n=1 Tax=Halospina sp. K52047b TaxID=2614160 RepID=UPI00124A9447|nr:fructosamine kinase family protein [Halospina sp. K52047b]KAA8981248.1 fructosamine kinase family protein [Halospina sp. K52047b]